MELSVSLTEEDVAVLDDYARTAGLRSRSAALHHATRLLRRPDLEEEYGAAWEEWRASGEEADRQTTAGDGRDGAAW